jgi:hypothetical protein
MPTIETNLPFECMCVAVERARQVRGADDGPWTVGVRDAAGELLASAMLDSHAQVKAFAAAMQDLGFTHSLLQAQEGTSCCDFTFRMRDPARAEGEVLHALLSAA